MIESASFRTCTLDDKPVPIEESRTYKILKRDYGEAYANQFVIEYEVNLKGK